MAALATSTNTTARKKITRKRPPNIVPMKRALDSEAYYSIREITDRTSPHYQASPATIFRALKGGKLRANYVGRKVFLKGAAIKNWIEGGVE